MNIIAQYKPVDHRYQLGAMDISLLFTALEKKGANISLLLDEVGVPTLDWQSDDVQMTYSDKLRIFQRVTYLYPNEGIGLFAGEQASFSHFGALGYAMATSRDVLQAAQIGFKHLRLNGPLFSVKMVQDQKSVIIEIDNSFDIGELLPFCTEFFLSSIVSLFNQMTGNRLNITRLSLRYRKPSYVEHYQQRFGSSVLFEQPKTQLIFERDVLDQPLLQHDAAMLSQTLNNCQLLMDAAESPYLLINQIKVDLFQRATSFPTIETIASEYGYSSRTLRRRLKEQRTSFQLLINDVKCALAKEYLMETELTVEEIAYQLGFSDAANFRRAFKNWTGVPPSKLRER